MVGDMAKPRWLRWLDLNQRIRESKSRAFTAWRHPNINGISVSRPARIHESQTHGQETSAVDKTRRERSSVGATQGTRTPTIGLEDRGATVKHQCCIGSVGGI